MLESRHMYTNHTVQDGSQNSQLTQTVTVLLRFAMIWLKLKIPIPKLVVTIYRLSFLWPVKRTVRFFYRSDNFALPFSIQCHCQ